MNSGIFFQKKRERDLAKLPSASEVDDAGSEGLEIGFVGRGFPEQTTPHGNSGTHSEREGRRRYWGQRVRRREGVDMMHCW
jgi:hypothetical protein